MIYWANDINGTMASASLADPDGRRMQQQISWSTFGLMYQIQTAADTTLGSAAKAVLSQSKGAWRPDLAVLGA